MGIYLHIGEQVVGVHIWRGQETHNIRRIGQILPFLIVLV